MNHLLLTLLVAAADPSAPAPGQEAQAQAQAQDAARVPSPPPAPPPAPERKPRTDAVYQVHLAVDIPVTIVAGSAGLVRVLFKEQLVHKSCPCDPMTINALDRGTVGNHSAAASLAGDVTVYGVMAALPLMDLLDLGWGRVWAEDLMVYAETLAIDTAIQNATNFATGRPRPRTYAGDPEFLGSAEGYLSFYAGHVATAFASLSMAAFTVRKRYGEHVWPWIVAGLVASSVGVERIASGHHFPTDVAVAAVAGTTIGITVPWLHLRRGKIPLAITPLGTNGVGLAGAF